MPSNVPPKATLLLVEDEDIVRRVLVSLLRKQGYSLLTARSAQEALEMSRAHAAEPVALLITDIKLPDMQGTDLAKKLAAERPQIKVLYMSGNPRDGLSDGITLEDSAHFVEKGDILAHLADIVARLLL